MIEQTEFPFQETEIKSDKHKLYIGLSIAIALLIIIIYWFENKRKKEIT